jgi:hypothetical protein
MGVGEPADLSIRPSACGANYLGRWEWPGRLTERDAFPDYTRGMINGETQAVLYDKCLRSTASNWQTQSGSG